MATLNGKPIPRYVITGSPGSGKSAVVNALYEMRANFYTMENVAEYAIKTLKMDPKKEFGKFHDTVLKTQIEWEDRFTNSMSENMRKGNETKIVAIFQNGGVYETYVRTNRGGEALKISKRDYSRIFILETLPDFNSEKERIPGLVAEAERNELERVYTDLCYPITIIPVMALENRIDLILKECGLR